MEFDDYEKGKDTGAGTLVAFKLKEEQLTLLNEMVQAFPKHMTRSDVIRAMVMPYCKALELAKEGKEWQGALQFGKGLVKLKKFLKQAAEEEATEELDFTPDTVTAVPNL